MRKSQRGCLNFQRLLDLNLGYDMYVSKGQEATPAYLAVRIGDCGRMIIFIHRRTRSRIVGSEAPNGLEALVTTKFPQVEKSAHPMKVMLETSDFPFFISHCCRTCLDEVIALSRT